MIPLNCPFCGLAPATGVSLRAEESKTEMGYVGCLNSACHVRPKVSSVMPVGEGEYSAIRRWNCRA